MARSVRSPVEARSTRLRLPARREPYWQQLQPGLSIGYYRPRSGATGRWWVRLRTGGRYKVKAFAAADDHIGADGETILSWPQAQEWVRLWATRLSKMHPYFPAPQGGGNATLAFWTPLPNGRKPGAESPSGRHCGKPIHP